MISRWIAAEIAGARWSRFGLAFVLWAAFNWWAFGMDSPWTRALAAAGGRLPETQAGYPPTEPWRSLDALGPARNDYFLWQAYDIPYAVLNVVVASIAMALALKAVRLEASLLRWLLVLPPIYLFAEIVENLLLALCAANAVGPGEAFVLVQQTATTIKFASGFASMALGGLSLVVAAVAALVGFARRRR